MQRKKRSRKKGGRGVAGEGAQTGSSVHGIFPGKNTGVGCRFLLQELFPTQGLNLSLLGLLHGSAGKPQVWGRGAVLKESQRMTLG